MLMSHEIAIFLAFALWAISFAYERDRVHGNVLHGWAMQIAIVYVVATASMAIMVALALIGAMPLAFAALLMSSWCVGDWLGSLRVQKDPYRYLPNLDLRWGPRF